MALHYCQNITHLLFKDRPLAPLKEMDLARQIEAEMILLGQVYYTALLKLCNAVTEEMQYLKICFKIVCVIIPFSVGHSDKATMLTAITYYLFLFL